MYSEIIEYAKKSGYKNMAFAGNWKNYEVYLVWGNFPLGTFHSRSKLLLVKNGKPEKIITDFDQTGEIMESMPEREITSKDICSLV